MKTNNGLTKILMMIAISGIALGLTIRNAHARTLGMVASDATKSITVFDADTSTVLGSVSTGADGILMGDCSVTSDETKGFVTNFGYDVFVIDLSGPVPILGGAPNPIPISNAGEDVAPTPDGKFLVVCDGDIPDPVSVVDVATQAEIGTFPLGGPCTSVDVCSDGSVLVTGNDFPQKVRRLTIDGAGALTDTGEALTVGDAPYNVYCAPGDASGVVVFFNGSIQSFSVPGLSPVDTRTLSGAISGAGAMHPAGDRFFVRSALGPTAFVDAFSYDSATGALGASPLFTAPAEDDLVRFGIDSVAVHPDGAKLYVADKTVVRVYDATNGASLGSITDPSINEATGVCVANSTPAQDVEDIIEQVDGFDLPDGLSNALEAKLQKALDAIEQGDVATACSELQAFENQVMAQSGKKMTAEQAAELLEAVDQIQSEIGCA